MEDPLVGDAFVADHLDQLTPEAFVPVRIFVCSHTRCKILRFVSL
jgi:hypothetical protein